MQHGCDLKQTKHHWHDMIKALIAIGVIRYKCIMGISEQHNYGNDLINNEIIMEMIRQRSHHVHDMTQSTQRNFNE